MLAHTQSSHGVMKGGNMGTEQEGQVIVIYYKGNVQVVVLKVDLRKEDK